ncbi:MAG: ribose-phosphate pyrophosphokinase [Lachnospiraceae bacterium]|jgi:ribose-phosphate pyrophosphokinase|nr:ribose-phosphate pyrophosphokinase [Lachnospiraceae bacterium]
MTTTNQVSLDNVPVQPNAQTTPNAILHHKPNLLSLEAALPIAPLKIIALPSAQHFAERINSYLVAFRKSHHNKKAKGDPAFHGYIETNYLSYAKTPRFGTGESKAILSESVRGKDLFILVDVFNHSITYEAFGFTNHMSPDDHFQDLKRVIAACNGKARRVNVIMPYLYEGRQDRRNGRESLDCACALRELTEMGVSNFITFDAHDPRVQNAAPLKGFDNFIPPYQFIKALLDYEKELVVDKNNLVIISPDRGGLDRAIYFATVLGVDVGMFYKRRNYSVIIKGSNPIVAHEYLGESVDGKDVIIIDDMISSGNSIIDTARHLKRQNARKVFMCCTFGLFTEGLDAFDAAYEENLFQRIITTDLAYLPRELYSRPYFIEAQMSKFVASLIDFMNHDLSLNNVMTPTDKIHEIVNRFNNRLDIDL